MAIELNFNRRDHSIPWGFRLTGGTDLDLPVTVIKVTEKSIAEEAGMKVGDLLVRVGDTATAGLTHLQVHDMIKVAGNIFAAAVIRGELPAQVTETEQTIDSETIQDGISQTVQINIKANVTDTTQIVVENDEIIEQNIKINGTTVSDQEEQNIEVTIKREEKISEEVTVEKSSQETRSEITESQAEQIKDELSISLEKFMQPPECIRDSEVLKVINEERKGTKEDKATAEKRWTTFLQKPDRPKPKINRIEDDEPKNSPTNENYYEEHVLLTRLLSVIQEPPYRVVIQKQKKKRDEEKARSKEVSQDTTPVPPEMMAEAVEVPEQEQEEKEDEQHEEVKEENEQRDEGYEQIEEPMISEVEMSLEDQLAAIQKQLLALSQLPAAIQQTLDVVTQQLTKIVGPVNDPNTEEENDAAEVDDYQDDTFDDTERETGELETLEEVSESGFDRDSQQGDTDQDTERREGEEGEFDKPEPELEMLQVTPEPEEDLTPEEREARRIEREKMDKQQKENAILSDLRQRRIKAGDYPLTPLQRPICLPGGRRWHAPDDAHPSVSPRHHDMSDEQIAETISAQTEVIVGTTLGDANTHLVPSKAIDTNKINFLKYQPPPKTLDHLKHSEVFRLVHDMDQPVRGVGARAGKAMAEEDYLAQARKSGQEGQMKG